MMNNLISPPFPTAFPSNKMRVLLVEHDIQLRDNVINMLHCFSYEVAAFDFPSAAISALSTEEAGGFDIMMVDLNSPDICVLQLITIAMKMNLLVVLMTTDEDNTLRTLRASQQGVIWIEKPVTMQILECLWQHVFREKVCRFEHAAKALEAMEYGTHDLEDMEHYVTHAQDAMEHNAMHAQGAMEHNVVHAQEAIDHNATQEDSIEGNEPKSRKNKNRMQWTEELHEKFMLIVTELGEGRCYPRSILQRMNEPNLTRMQVASHLQICRTSNWRPNRARPQKQARAKAPAPPTTRLPNDKKPRYGAMPLLGTEDYQHKHSIGVQENSEFNMSPATETNDSSYKTYIVSNQSDAVSAEDSFGSQNLEYSVTQNPIDVAFQKELDLSDNGSFLSLLVDNYVDYDEIQTGMSQWSPDVPESMNDEAAVG